jgi:hypothetical protein
MLIEEALSGDYVVCLLGCDSPMLLRERSEGTFLVVGECFIHELNDSKSILGPLPSSWRVHFFTDSLDRFGVYRYFNAESGELVDLDPRTGTSTHFGSWKGRSGPGMTLLHSAHSGTRKLDS